MNLSEFLKQSSNKNFWQNKKIICFKGKDYPVLFLNNFFSYFSKKELLPAEYKNFVVDKIDEFGLLQNLNQSFLGQKKFYWLGKLNFKLSNKKEIKLLEYLLSYNGPNFASFYLDESILTSKFASKFKKILIIDLDSNVNFFLFEVILNAFDYKISNKKSLIIKKIFQQNTDIHLDQIYLMMNILELSDLKKDEDLVLYLFSIVEQQKPKLNLLAQYFFSKQSKHFFKVWSQIKDNYSDMFWLSFWSEQIFRAYFVLKFLNEKNIIKAKSVSFRLPFSFLKKDWKNFSLKQLSNYCNFIYNIDFALKTGSNFCAIDLFYFNHFINN